MLKIIPLLALRRSLACAGADDWLRIRGRGVADHRGPGSDCEDSGQDEAHHRNRVARRPRTFLISWWGIPSIGT